MNDQEIIRLTEEFITAEFGADGSGHDWFHIDRVRKMAIKIGLSENCDLFIVEMAALLHDLDDWKLTDSNENNLLKTENWLKEVLVSSEISNQILKIIHEVSFQGAETQTPVSSVEAAVVQDADRLDAIEAIGIARTFAYGGHKNRLIYDPDISPVMYSDFQQYQKSTAPTLNHFYEKLLLLKNRMNTETAKRIAEGRHLFMENYLRQFMEEWDAKK